MRAARKYIPLTADRLRDLLAYDPDTGLFTWRRSRGCVKVGAIAGTDNGRGYLKFALDKVHHFAHRLAFLYMTGRWPEGEVDHINRIKTDNRWTNLRDVTKSVNQQNRSLVKSRGTSKLRGVCWYKRTNKWKAQINDNGKKIGLGYFHSEQEAYSAYIAAKKLLHPVVARTM